MRVVAFVEARTPSTRLPGKHFEMVGPWQLVEWPIKACINTPEIDATVVNSNSSIILGIGRELGAKTLERPNNIGLLVDSKKPWWLPLYTSWIDNYYGEADEDTIILRIMGNAVIFDRQAIGRLVSNMKSTEANGGLIITRCRGSEHPYYAMEFSGGVGRYCSYRYEAATLLTDADFPVQYRDDESVVAVRLPSDGRVGKLAYSIATEPSHHVHDQYDLECARVAANMREPKLGLKERQYA